MENNIKRKLYSTDNKCSSECLYCFADWNGYESQDVFAIEALNEEYDIICPCCDGEVSFNSDFLSILDRIREQFDRPKIITISTKRKISEENIKKLRELNDRFVRDKKGLVKISITLTNISRIHEIEPGTASFKDRINTLGLLAKYNLPRAVIIKPVLPFIDKTEYEKIIEITSEFTDLFLLGVLYVEKSSVFYNNYIKDKYEIENKEIEWLDNKPSNSVFSVIESMVLKNQIKDYIHQKKLLCFDSDIELVNYLQKNIERYMIGT